MVNANSGPHYDVIVIGAGSVGVPAAFYLASSGLRTLVLDQYPSPGQGSNKRAIGGIRATHSDPTKIRLSMRSLDIFSTWKEIYGDDIEWTQGGYVFVAYRDEDEKTLKELLVVHRSLGLNIDWVDTCSLRQLIPGLRSNHLLGGTYSPEDGNASPLLALHAFYKQAIARGADFHFSEPVIDIITHDQKVKGVMTSKNYYSANVVINAAGSDASRQAELSKMKIAVTPDCHEAGITEAVAHMFSPMVVDIRSGPGSSNFYFYQHCTGQILFCITPSPSIWGDNTHETSAFLPQAARRLVDIMPKMKNLRVRRTWRGLYPMTPDGFPIVGWSKTLDGYLLAVGMCGQGFMLGPAVGELLTRMLLNQVLEADIDTLACLSPYRKFVGQEKLK